MASEGPALRRHLLERRPKLPLGQQAAAYIPDLTAIAPVPKPIMHTPTTNIGFSGVPNVNKLEYFSNTPTAAIAPKPATTTGLASQRATILDLKASAKPASEANRVERTYGQPLAPFLPPAKRAQIGVEYIARIHARHKQHDRYLAAGHARYSSPHMNTMNEKREMRRP